MQVATKPKNVTTKPIKFALQNTKVYCFILFRIYKRNVLYNITGPTIVRSSLRWDSFIVCIWNPQFMLLQKYFEEGAGMPTKLHLVLWWIAVCSRVCWLHAISFYFYLCIAKNIELSEFRLFFYLFTYKMYNPRMGSD